MVDIPSLGRRSGTNKPASAPPVFSGGMDLAGSGEAGELMSGWLVKSPPTLDSKKPIFNPVSLLNRYYIIEGGGCINRTIVQKLNTGF